ncbi:Arginine-tRNA-protein transferase [Venturia nashicola]|nr:Arginine-tRNA-protein transferase [Venturia nashicola]
MSPLALFIPTTISFWWTEAGADPVPSSTNQIFDTHVVHITQSGKSTESSNRVWCLLISFRLPVHHFNPRRDQRQAVNRWNKYVLGDEFVKESAKLHPKSKAEKARRNEFDLVTAVHESEHVNLKRPPEPAHEFEVTLEADDYTDEKFELYKNYQHHVHHDSLDSISPNSFKRFLCHSPLQRSSSSSHVTKKLGSFHQCYRLDGRLIAMAVLDLLPHCVSGVYFVYHSDFEQWSFGKISALREAALAFEGGYQYYYMGYYIHSCPKMLYKNDYKPQMVLDLANLTWSALDDQFRKLLDEHHYLSPSLVEKGSQNADRQNFASALAVCSAIDGGLSLFKVDFPGMISASELIDQVDLDEISVQLRPDLVLHTKHLMKWEDWSIHSNDPKGLIAQIAACVGPEVAREMIISFC